MMKGARCPECGNYAVIKKTAATFAAPADMWECAGSRNGDSTRGSV